MTGTQDVTIPVKYYAANADRADYLIVTAALKDHVTDRVVGYSGAASAIAGNPHQVVGEEFSSAYLATTCHRVAPDAVPTEWKAVLDRYRLDHQPDAAMPKAKAPNPFAERQKSDPGLER